MNKVILIGRLTRDPELRFTAGSGSAVTTFTLAVDRNFKNKDGQKEADFINIVVWNKLAEIIANNVTKGKLVAVSGRLQTRTYEGNDGQKKYITEVVADDFQFLEKRDGSGPSMPRSFGGGTSNANAPEEDFFPADGDEDIPF
jgi:single stranded DNA-binding protein (ssb)